MYSMRVESLDPPKAERWLSMSIGNRSFNPPTVELYATQMKNGTFPINGATFVFSDKGRFMDGHHRCKAVIKANVKIQVLVVRGVPEDTFYTIDSGKGRSAGDVLTIEGIPNSFNTAAMANILINLQKTGQPETRAIAKSGRPSKRETSEFVHAHLDRMQESIRVAGRIKGLGPLSAFAACHYMCSEKDKEAADTFFGKIATGENLSKNEPVWRLREILRNYALMPHRVSQKVLMAVVIKAWNATRGAKEVKQLVFKGIEEFPKVI